jgi:hypothetical protein
MPVLREKLLPLWLLPLLIACSDQRAAFEIGTSQHSLTLIRVQNFFWDKTALLDRRRAHARLHAPARNRTRRRREPGRSLCAGQRRLDSQTGQAHVCRRDAHL